MIHADRNAFYYMLDRETGEFLLGKEFAHQTWAKGIDAKGRPIVLPNTDPTPKGTYICPDDQRRYQSGPRHLTMPPLDCSTCRSARVAPTTPAKPSSPKLVIPSPDGDPRKDLKRGVPERYAPSTRYRRHSLELSHALGNRHCGRAQHGRRRAVRRGSRRQSGRARRPYRRGALAYQTGGSIQSSPISYEVDGKQYIAIAGDSTLFVFGLK